MSKYPKGRESSDPEPLKLQERLERDARQMLKVIDDRETLVPDVLRFHLLIESFLDRLIEARLPAAVHFFAQKPRFSLKLAIVQALELLRTQDCSAIKALNETRNALAHRRGREVTIEDLQKIAEPICDVFPNPSSAEIAALRKAARHVFVVLYSEVAAAVANEEFDAIERNHC